jgi:hypothetical protein
VLEARRWRNTEVEVIGHTSEMEDFFAVTVERRITHPMRGGHHRKRHAGGAAWPGAAGA